MNREQAKAIYLEFVNDYLTVECYADHHGLSDNEASALINLVREIYYAKHPSA